MTDPIGRTISGGTTPPSAAPPAAEGRPATPPLLGRVAQGPRGHLPPPPGAEQGAGEGAGWLDGIKSLAAKIPLIGGYFTDEERPATPSHYDDDKGLLALRYHHLVVQKHEKLLKKWGITAERLLDDPKVNEIPDKEDRKKLIAFRSAVQAFMQGDEYLVAVEEKIIDASLRALRIVA